MKIVIAVDGEQCANTALEYVFGGRYNAESEFYLVHVIVPAFADVIVEGIPDITGEERKEEQEILARMSKAIKDKLGAKAQTDIIEGEIAEVIADACKRFNADETIVPTHARHGFSRLWFGSVADDIVDATPCTTIVLKMPQENKAH